MTAPAAPSPGTPLVHFTMDGTLGAITSGGTIADSSGNGHTATITGAGASYVGGVMGQAIKFTSPSYLDTGDLGQSSAWTESVWINIPAANISTLAYFTDARQGGGNGYNLSFNNGGSTLLARIPNAVGGDVLDIGESFPLSADAWHLLTTTVGSGTFDVYLDGTLKASATYTGTAQLMSIGDGLRICARFSTGAYQFTGSVDDFNMYSSVLTGDQIQRLYVNGVSGLPIGTPLQVTSGGVFDMGGGVQTVSSLTDGGGGGGGRVINSNTGTTSTLTLSPTGGTTTFTGSIVGGSGSGVISLVMSGSGTQVLAGTNTYTGGTTVSSGTLDFAGPDATPSEGIVTVNPGGYVVLGALAGRLVARDRRDRNRGGHQQNQQDRRDDFDGQRDDGDARRRGRMVDRLCGQRRGAAAVPEPGTLVLLAAAAAGLAIAARQRKRTAR